MPERLRTSKQSLDEQELINDFLFLVLKARQSFFYKLQEGMGQPHVYSRDFKTLKVPLPPLSIQQEIVSEIEEYQKVIDGARQVVASWKPRIDIDPEWPLVRLGDVCGIFGGGTPSRTNEKFWSSGTIKWISSRYITDEVTSKLKDRHDNH